MLRPDGLLVFSTGTPIQELCWNEQDDRIEPVLHHDYFGMHAIRDERDEMVQFQLPYGDWIRLFRRHGFVVEDLIETRPPEGTTSTYRTAEDLAWARRWPMENIWRVRKAPGP